MRWVLVRFLPYLDAPSHVKTSKTVMSIRLAVKLPRRLQVRDVPWLVENQIGAEIEHSEVNTIKRLRTNKLDGRS